MFGSKKLAAQYETRLIETKDHYEARITELKAQMADLRKMVFSATSASNVPLVSLEADAIFSQRDEVLQLSPEEMNKLDEEASEANRILSGNY